MKTFWLALVTTACVESVPIESGSPPVTPDASTEEKPETETTPVQEPDPECQSDDDCEDGDTCWVNPVALWSRCVESCETDDDCEGSKRCRTMYGARACVDPIEDEEVPVIPIDDVDETEDPPFEIECFGAVDEVIELAFTLDDTATSAMFVPFAVDGGALNPIALTVPDGRTLDLRIAGNSFLATTASLLGVTAPLFLPQSPIAAELVQPGAYTFTLEASTQDLCAYLVTETAAADRFLDLNLYHVSLQGRDAAAAADDPRILQALEAFEAIFAGADVELGVVNHFDVPANVAQDFAIIDNVNTQPGPLVATSLPPDDGNVLSVNVFLVDAMIDRGVIGISQGLPGPIGLHGSLGSGVVLTAEFLSETGGPELTGQLLAHELGHWLGLFHTSEIAGGFFDPINDTDQCQLIARFVDSGTVDRCPDFLNLMFPFANADAVNLTADQASVLIANPVTR